VVIAALRGSRLVFEKHSDPSSYKKGLLRNLIMALYSKAERFSIRHADACIGTGPGLAAQIRKAGGKAVHDISDIPSSQVEADPARAAAIRAGWLRTPDDVLAAYVGSFAVYQGVDLLFEAIPQVLAGNSKVRFVVIGGTTEEIAQRREWLRARNVEDSVIFPGRIAPDALPDYLAASDILLSPRRAGVNTPLKLLDYLKAGGAIVATDLEANRLILDESNAMLTPPDAKHFAAGILRLAADAGLRKRLAEDGRKLIDRTYNYAEFKRRLGLCYEDLF
jgi:glycosyltransferase involved in cell wall biosynthesis